VRLPRHNQEASFSRGFQLKSGEHYGRGTLSADPYFGELTTPPSLNKYLYAYANPYRWVDLEGYYGIDVHYYLTKYLAKAAGLSEEEATLVAVKDQYVDDNPKTNPLKSSNGDWKDTFEQRKLHFPGSVLYHREKKVVHDSVEANEGVNAALSQFKVDGDKQTFLTNLGTGLHTLQDSYSHEGFEAAEGHEKELTKPDIVYLDAPKTFAAAKRTFEILCKARGMSEKETQEKFDSIQDTVTNFSNEKNDTKRLEIIGQQPGEYHEDKSTLADKAELLLKTYVLQRLLSKVNLIEESVFKSKFRKQGDLEVILEEGK
jgi:hypothetical protein